MNRPTPRDAAPAVERRKELVSEAMGTLEDVAELGTAEQLARLDEVQGVLAAVLDNRDAGQLGIPGLPRRP